MTQARAVRFDLYGGRDVLYVDDIPMPEPAAGEVVVAVRAAGINPGEAVIRSGVAHDYFPATFPSGQGSDLAGIVTAVGPDADGFAVGDEVLGFSWRRSSHATHAAVPVGQLIRKPPQLGWAVAGSLYIVGCTAYAAVHAVEPKPGETVAVSAATGGVGAVTVQLLARRGVRVLGIASATNADWLAEHGAVPVIYGEGLRERILTAAGSDGVDAFIDLFGPQYLDLAVDLGITSNRIETIASHMRAWEIGAKTEGSMNASTREVLAELAGLVATGAVEVPIAATYPLDRVTDAFAELEQRHTRGKIVLIP
ncbi:MAG: NADP-dependent oxidoreductase [Streptosporangiaceae bacterium]